MSGFFQDLLNGAVGGFFGSDNLRDYTHASKTFRPNSYENAPKYKFLFHTYFEINPELLNAGVDSRQNYGLLVKDIKLPSYTFDTVQLNQYNRKRVIQTKIKYDPVTITFHDDNGSNITRLWEAYYRYNYRDGGNPEVMFSGNRGNASGGDVNYNNRNIYESDINGADWGYVGDTFSGSNKKVPFFKNIKVFGFYQHNFTAYTLINPIITAFNHDTYNYTEGSGIMQNTMTIDYETVVYNYGAIDGNNPDNIVTGFGSEENYDRRRSPIAIPNSNAKILGPGGLVDSVGGTLEAIGSGNILGAIKTAGSAYYTFKDRDLKQTAKQELLNGVSSALTNPNVTRNITNWVQQVGSTPSPIATASAPTAGATTFAAINTAAGITRTAIPNAGGQVNRSGAGTGWSRTVTAATIPVEITPPQ
jgi:hypothetical protein